MVKRVVIIGGGLSAKHTAELLVKNKAVQVTMIQANQFVEWPLAMTYVLARPDEHSKALAADSSKFQVPGVEYKYGVATGVDVAKKEVYIGDTTVPYEALIVATGFRCPLLYPALGVTLEERKREIAEAGAAIRDAQSIVISGAGVIGLELAGDIKVAHPQKQVSILCRDQVVKDRPEAQRAKILKVLQRMSINVITGKVEDAPGKPAFEKGTLHVGDLEVSYDVYLPAFAAGPNTSFLKDADNILDEQGRMKVNSFLQCVGSAAIFGVGVTDVEEFVGMPKLEAQWTSVCKNVMRLLDDKTLEAHKEGMPGMKRAAFIKIGNGKDGWGFLDFTGLPCPVQVCCCCGYGGFPCCPPCSACCCICPCGYCCLPPEGSGPARFGEMMVFRSFGMHFKGTGVSEAPAQQKMS